MTAALPYIQGMPHLGNAAGSVLPADIFHRYLDVKGVENIFICGSDVHGTPLELEAIEREKDVEDLKEEQHEKVKKAYEDLNMDFSIYGDTDSEYNRKQTLDMFTELYCNGHITEKTQNLPYCKDDERFLPDRYIEGECPHCGGLARGDQCDDCGKLLDPEEIVEPVCQICGEQDIIFKDTKHLFLKLEEFKDELKQWFNSDPKPVPETMEKQVKNDIENAEDRAITRDQEWGFDIPIERVNKKIEEENLDVEKLDADTYDDKVLYVWFDAPIGYIGFTRELFEDKDWQKWWADEETDVYYSIGKDNTIFHTVIWPSMLLGASTDQIKYNLPKYEFIQQYLMWEDKAFSTSRGIGVWINEATDLYPADYWRFYVSRMLPETQDTNFSWQDFEDDINNVLNDTVGNFVNRTLSLAEKWFDGKVPEADYKETDKEFKTDIEKIIEEFNDELENHNLKNGLEKALEIARTGDEYLSQEEPWNNKEKRAPTIKNCLNAVNALAPVLYPYIPDSAEKIKEMLNKDLDTSEETNELKDIELGEGHKLGDKEILFEKIDVSDKIEDEEESNEVSFEDFQKMDIKTGRVEKVKDHPNADKLYIVKVDIGDKTLQTCAGLVDHYEKSELEGREVVVLTNLEETELRGEKSECMMLAAESEDGEKVSLLKTESKIEKGSKIK